MQGLQLTYETLGATRNEAAIDVLIAALDDDNATTRRFALGALLSRGEQRAPEMVLACWDKLLPDDLRVLRPKKKWMTAAIEKWLGGSDEQIETAIAAAETLQATDVLPALVLMAESSASRAVKKRTSEAVLKLVEPLGNNARADRDQPSVRGPVQARLADSVRRIAMHRNELMVDAFLLVSTWGDGDFRQMLSDSSQEFDLLCKRLAASDHPSIIELLAGFIRRRKIHKRICQLVQSRKDELFRDALLRKISAEPTATVLRNLKEIGLPECLDGGEAILDEIPPEYRAAVSHAYAASCDDPLTALHVVAAAVERGSPGCDSAAALGFSRCEVPDVEFWMRAAVPVANADEDVIKSDPNAHLLKRLIDLLDHPNANLVRSVRRVLEPLHAEQMLGRFQELRSRSRRRLGRVVMMVDPEAIQKVRDALRHPVLDNRLDAIAMADALAAVDLLSDSFEHIAREDHQEARILAAEVMGEASGEVTMDLLRELTSLPECPVKDAALKAIERRATTKAR